MRPDDAEPGLGAPGAADPAQHPRTPEERWTIEARSRMLFLGVVFPAITVAVGVLLLLSYLPELPESIVVNWGPGGSNSMGSPWLAIILLPLVVLPITIGYTASVSGALQRRSTTRLAQAGAAFTVGMSVFLTGLITSSTGIQRGTGAGGGPVPGGDEMLGWAVLWIVLALAAGAAAWFLAPRPLPAAQATGSEATAAPILAIAPGERGYWVGSLNSPWGLHLALWLVTLGTVVLMVLAQAPIWATLLLLAALLPAALLLNWRATVDHRGVYATGVFGWPRVGVPLAQVRRATVVDIEPMADFGGWGMRIGFDNQFGVVVRRGPAIRVERSDGKRTMVITHPDAATAVALLNALVEARRVDPAA